MQERMAHGTLWNQTTIETNRYAVQLYRSHPSSSTLHKWFSSASNKIQVMPYHTFLLLTTFPHSTNNEFLDGKGTLENYSQ
jgi:hypothetical protein